MRFPIFSAIGFVIVVILVVWGINELEKPSSAQLDAIKSQLPAGCIFTDLGEYGSIDNVVMVNCKRQDVTSSTSYDRQGKLKKITSAIVIN